MSSRAEAVIEKPLAGDYSRTRAALSGRMKIPMFGAPMFLVSSPALVAAQCRAGIVGVLPCLNLRPSAMFEQAVIRIRDELQAWDIAHPEAPAAPLAVNLMVHPSNTRLDEDLAMIREHQIELVVTSLNPPERVVQAIHDYGGLVFHDVSQVRHARRAVAAGVDGLVLVCTGAGGHTGKLNPLAFIAEVRDFYPGPLAVGGAIRNGAHILALQVAGADFAYCGSAFIATPESSAGEEYKAMVVASAADDVLVTNAVSGLYGSYMRNSFERLGIDVESLQHRQSSSFDLTIKADGTKTKAWKDIWSAGQGVGGTRAIESAMDIVSRFDREYNDALAKMRERLLSRLI